MSGPSLTRAVAVRKEVQAAAGPHGVRVVRILPGDLLDGRVGDPRDPDRRGPPATVALPGEVPLGVHRAVPVGDVGDPGAVRREAPLGHPGERDLGGQAARQGHRVQPAEKSAAGNEEHPLAIRRPPLHPVHAGVPGQPARHAPCGRHQVDVVVPLVIAGEGHPPAVRRKGRVDLDSRAGREPAGIPSFARDHPEIARVREGDLVAAQGGLPQPRLGPQGQGGQDREEENRQGDESAHVLQPFFGITRPGRTPGSYEAGTWKLHGIVEIS
jgi:hypothetical protein